MTTDVAKQIEELEARIAEETNPILQKAYQAKLNSLQGKGGMIGTGMTADQYEEVDAEPTFLSSFPQKGDWPAEFGFPFDDTVTGQDDTVYDVIRFPFHVPADGFEIPFEARDDSLIFFKGIPKPGYHSPIKGALQALNVQYKVSKKGEVMFNPDDVEGKLGKVLYRIPRGQTYTDPITGEEKESTIARARAVVSMEASEPEGDIPF